MPFSNSIILKTLTPVHIGSGDELSPNEYLVDNRFHRLNMRSLFEDTLFVPYINDFITLGSQQRYIGDMNIKKELLKKHILYSINIDVSANDYIINHKTNVKTFIKTTGKVFIPGSSIKGSILSALIWYVLLEKAKGEKNKIKEFFYIDRDRDIQRKKSGELFDLALSLISGEIISDVSNKRFLHWLDISDSDTLSPEQSLNLSLAQVIGSRKNILPILYETLIPNDTFKLTVGLKKIKFTMKDILDITDQFYRRIMKVIDYKGPQSSGFIARLGQGSSAFSTSLLILAQDLNMENEYSHIVKPPSTQKLIGNQIPMGWVECKFI